MNTSAPPFFRKISTRLRHHSLTLCVCTLIATPLAAQTKDPYTEKPQNRTSASLPLAAGLIVSANYPLWGTDIASESDNAFKKSLRYEIAAYIDAWQVAFSHKSYGSIFSIVPRSVGRDTYYSWSVQYGWQSVTDARAFGSDSGKEFSRTIYALGFHYSTGYDRKVKTAFYSEMVLGAGIGDVAQGETEAIESYLLLGIEGGVGVRVPIGISGVTLGAYGGLSMGPPEERISGDPAFLLELGLRVSGALNVNL